MSHQFLDCFVASKIEPSVTLTNLRNMDSAPLARSEVMEVSGQSRYLFFLL